MNNRVQMARLGCLSLALVLAFSHLGVSQPNGAFPGGIPGGMRRVIKLNRDTFLAAIKANPVVVVFFQFMHDASYAQMQEQQMEVAAASTEGQNVKFAIVNMRENQLLGKELGLSPVDSIIIYRKDHVPQEYFGQRVAQYIVPYVMEMITPVINKIEGKQQKKLFDQFAFSKVVAYLEPDGAMIKWYRRAAEHFRPVIPFYEVYDKKLARSLRLKQINTIHFIKPYEKFLTVPPTVKDYKEMVKFIYQNRRQTLTKLRMSDVHLVWGHMFSANMFAAFIKPKTAGGTRFLSTLKSVSQHYHGNNSLHFVWVDSDEFPSLLEQWKESYGIDMATRPFAFGYIKMSSSEHAWFDMSAQEPTVKNIRLWLDAAMNGQIEMSKTSLANPSASSKESASPSEEGAEEGEEGEEQEEEKHTEL